MAELGQETVEFSTLVSRAAEESFVSLKELVDKSRSSDMSDSEKKINLLKYIVKTQQRMLRLSVLGKWCQQVPLIQYCQQLQSTLSNHDTCFTQAADSMFFMHEGLQQARAPIYDVPSAMEILLTGTYERLPKCIEDVGILNSLAEDQQKPALKKLDTLLRSKLLEVSVPREFSEVKISDGTATLFVKGEFKVLVTLGYRGHLELWRLLHMELLVGERSGPVMLEELRRYALGEDIERRMAAAENPFMTLYSVLHELCVALIMDTVIRQVQALRQGRWKDSIRFELISDGMGQGGSSGFAQTNQEGEADSVSLRTPGLKILYWLDFEKNSTPDSGCCPFIKIEPGADQQIKCVHSTFVVDPLTGKEADFYLDQSCIDVEMMLLRAICCNRYTRLFEIQKVLAKNSQICRVLGDVVLQGNMDEPGVDNKKKDSSISNAREYGQEVLRVRAYGSLFFTLGINIRSGRFLLQSSGNLLTPSTLIECEEALNQGSMTAAEVFFSMRSKSILHLFASIGRFLGLEVYENKLSTVKVPKNILNGSTWTLMGFPDCGSSYYLLMQLDRDFMPLFKLLETQPDSSGRPHLLGHLNNVTRIINIDIGQMQILDDELNLSLLDSRKVLSALPNAGGFIQSSENCPISNFSREGYLPTAMCTQSSFSKIIDEVFEFEKGAQEPSLSTLSVQNFTSPSNSSAASHFVSVPMNLHGINNATKVPNVSPHYNGSLNSNNTKGSIRSSSINSLYSGLARSTAIKKLQASKSDQNLASVRSPQSVELDSRSTSGKLNGPKSIEPAKVAGSNLIIAPTTCQLPETATFHTSSLDPGFKNDKNPRKRTVSDLLNLIPSLQVCESNEGFNKRRKILESGPTQQLSSQTTNILYEPVCKNEGYSYGNLIAEATKGNAPSSVFVSTLLHVVRHCSLSIKHARLISQMEALDIPYVEEAGLGNASSNLWFRLPFSQGNPWPHICLRLGKPGNMYWDVKINDQHFRDLWDLQKAINSSPWGSGVRIANTSDIDSHIRFDPEGVVLSYESVEADSIKKLVADICRLSNARMFALGMRKLLGVRPDERLEESSDSKALVGTKSVVDTADKLSEQMRKTFRIEAVGLMSLWFSFGSGVLARFVVEWESDKEGCTMHVSPDQLWPHTKFLEDFINGAEVASLLDCIRLTAGPLHALAAAIRPARAGPVSGVPGLAAAISSISKPNGYMPSQGPLPSSSPINAGQSTSASVLSTTTIPVGSPNFQGAAMLAAAAGRGGPGIVPSSLLPIDVSVVLRGPYWIRIIYRKYFAVDMRCFAGDQVWLQPATPPKVGPSVGGSLPCPQFRPFIMEHVAQELNGLEPNFTGGQHTTSNNPNPSVNGTRVNIPNSNGISRSGLPVRRSPGTVPAHVRGELNTAIIGLGDDGGYGGGWVPLVALKKVLRGILKYLGVLWLFAQLPDLLKEILGSILKDNEGALLNLDQEQPALRFFVGGYVFAVSVHRVQLLLQVLSVKRFHHQQQQQQNSASAQEELTQSEIGEICDYFSRRVASEPYDASRVASFITLLTLPISVLREFLKLIAWKKGLAQTQGGDIVPTQKPRIELCLENHAGLNMDENSETSCASKSNIHYDRSHNSVDFGLTVVLDPAHIPHINAAGGAAWLPYCVSVRLRYSFGENPNISFLKMEGSHGGKACWQKSDDWEKCKQRVARTLEMNNGSSSGDVAQGRLKMVADVVQRTLQMCLQGFRDGPGPINTSLATM